MSKSRSTARLLIPVLLVTASISGYYSWTFNEQRVAAERTEQRVRREANTTQQAVQALVERLQPDARPAANLETAFGTTVSLLNTNRLEQGITLSNITSGSGLNSSGATSLDAVAQRVPGTPVRTMRLNVRGTYRDHARLLAYFDALRANGVAVVFLKVEKNNFEAGLRVFGS